MSGWRRCRTGGTVQWCTGSLVMKDRLLSPRNESSPSGNEWSPPRSRTAPAPAPRNFLPSPSARLSLPPSAPRSTITRKTFKPQNIRTRIQHPSSAQAQRFILYHQMSSIIWKTNAKPGLQLGFHFMPTANIHSSPLKDTLRRTYTTLNLHSPLRFRTCNPILIFRVWSESDTYLKIKYSLNT